MPKSGVCKILIIEDSKATSVVLKEVLESEGHTVHLADDAFGVRRISCHA